ncbi:MAG: hypothetical protein JXP34_06810, partial [Planctomycetes bacterium]|nr:hypothetical protein [Planctomycetota bacterium]
YLDSSHDHTHQVQMTIEFSLEYPQRVKAGQKVPLKTSYRIVGTPRFATASEIDFETAVRVTGESVPLAGDFDTGEVLVPDIIPNVTLAGHLSMDMAATQMEFFGYGTKWKKDIYGNEVLWMGGAWRYNSFQISSQDKRMAWKVTLNLLELLGLPSIIADAVALEAALGINLQERNALSTECLLGYYYWPGIARDYGAFVWNPRHAYPSIQIPSGLSAGPFNVTLYGVGGTFTTWLYCEQQGALALILDIIGFDPWEIANWSFGEPWQVGKFLDFYQWAKLNHPIYGSQGDPHPFQQQVLAFQIDPSAGAYNPGTPGTTPEAEANEVLARVPVEPSVDLSQVVDMVPTLGRTGTQEPAAAFIRGDVDGNGSLQIGDAVYSLMYQFADGAAPPCLKASDLDDNGAVNISDPVNLLTYLFASGPAPKAPFPDCGEDPTADTLGCEAFAPCKDVWPPKPDLWISSVTWPPPVPPLMKTTFSIVVKNRGKADAGPCVARVAMTSTLWDLEDEYDLPIIRAGEEYTITCPALLVNVQAVTLQIAVDVQDVVDEVNETNNERTVRIIHL